MPKSQIGPGAGTGSDLFIQRPNFPDVAWFKISENPLKWQEEIIQHAFESLPAISPYENIQLNFTKEDQEKGYAAGYLEIINGDRVARLPFVIKDYQLSPFDIMVTKEKDITPLTKLNLERSLFNKKIHERKAPRRPLGGGSIYDSVTPPYMERYASPFMLDRILATISGTDRQEFVSFLENEKEILSAFMTGKSADMIKKITSLKPIEGTEFQDIINSIMPLDIILINKIDDEYQIMTNSRKAYYPQATKLTREEARQHLEKLTPRAEELLNKVDVDKQVMVHAECAMTNPRTFPVIGGPEITAKEPKKFGVYWMKNAISAAETPGIVFPIVLNYDLKRIPLKLFIGSEYSSLQENPVGKFISKPTIMPESVPEAGDRGTFYFHRNGAAVATLPFHVNYIVTKNGTRSIRGITVQGEPINFIMLPGIANIEKVKEIPPEMSDLMAPSGNYYIPITAKYLKLQQPVQLVEDAMEFEKISSLAQEAHKINLFPVGHNFAIQGERIKAFQHQDQVLASQEKLDYSNMPAAETKFALISMGIPSSMAIDVMAKAQNTGPITISNMQNIPTLLEKKSEIIRDRIEPMKKLLPKLKRNLLKEAAVIEDTDTVDKILSLNFVNPENIAIFLGSIPDLQKASSKLAKLLWASRLGMSEVPEKAVQNAMMAIESTIEALEELKLKTLAA